MTKEELKARAIQCIERDVPVIYGVTFGNVPDGLTVSGPGDQFLGHEVGPGLEVLGCTFLAANGGKINGISASVSGKS